ncbi:MAG: class I SAM-dependent methyltransferase, partial [Planctomycetales bacterium]
MNSGKAISTTRQLLDRLTETFSGTVAARLWDGSTWQSREDGTASFTLVLQHPGAARAMFWPFGTLALGESYIFNDFDIEGDTLAFADWLAHLMTAPQKIALLDQFRMLMQLLSLPNRKNPRNRAYAGRPASGKNSLASDSTSIEYTYDRPTELYREFLDPSMQYTCGYFADADEDLDVAQERKMDYICRKLRLKAGERFVDFG